MIMLVMAVSCLCFGIWWGGGITVAVGAGIVFLGSKIPLELLRRFSPSAALLIAVVILIMVHHYMRNQEKKLAHLCEYAERVLKYGETILANLLKGIPTITDLDTPFSNELLSGEEGVKYVRIESLRLYGEAIDREMRNIRNRLKKLGK
ncbi:MAG: hypothetical protein IJD13_06880 [Oscillospiraceae bacterium]|nr:hypothetical protein [Oscillospiraceae bacterium]